MRDINLLKECKKRIKGQEMKTGMKLFVSSDSNGLYAENWRFVESIRNDMENYKRGLL
jgi:hypothetical protein